MGGRWTLWNYFDIFGNETDGWEVNDMSREWAGLAIPDTDKRIIDFLIRRLRFINPEFAGIVRLDWLGDDWCEIVCNTNEMPLGRLVRE